MNDQPCANTDRELWRGREDDYYADSIHVTETGGIGINAGGLVIVKTLRAWVELAKKEILSDNPNALLPPLLFENSPAIAPYVVEWVEEKRWTAKETNNPECWVVGNSSITWGFSKGQANAIADAHNASLGEPREKEDLGEKEAAADLTHVRQNALLRKALAFYADPKDWHEFEARGKIGVADDGDSCMAFDKGEDTPWLTAKQAILSSPSNAVLPHPVSPTDSEIVDWLDQQLDLELRTHVSESEHYVHELVHRGSVVGEHPDLRCAVSDAMGRSHPVSESPVGSTAIGVSDEAIARKAAGDCYEKHHGQRFEIILTAIRKAKSDLERQDAAIRTLIAATGWCENEGSTFRLVTSVCGLQAAYALNQALAESAKETSVPATMEVV